MADSIDMGMNFNDVPEKVVLPAAKYTLRILKATSKGNEQGEKPSINIVHEVIGHPEASNVFHNLWLPNPSDDQAKKENKIRFIRGYMKLFSVPMNGSSINVNDFAGREAECTLTLKERMERGSDGGLVPTGVFDNVIKVQSA
jgi:hypothetical protein